LIAREFIMAWVCVLAWTSASPALAGECARDTLLIIGVAAGYATGANTSGATTTGADAADANADAQSRPIQGSGVRQIAVTEAQILALPARTVVTSTDWTPVSRFEGPLLSDVIALAATSGRTLTVLALNNYMVSIPWEDMAKFDPILAYRRDGERMHRDRFGPLFIVYPRDSFQALRAPAFAARMVWQVCRIDVE
jgi:hypothetical protein